MGESEILEISVTGHHLTENLSSDMYTDLASCIQELVRNGAVACMSSPDEWKPEKVKIEIVISKSHPLAKGGEALIILDHGRGFTDDDIRRFCSIGPSMERVASRSSKRHGADEKNIGRFAALSLNRKLRVNKDQNEGFFVLTRTSEHGKIRKISVIPSILEITKGFPSTTIESHSNDLKDVPMPKGPFSAIVIPHPMITSHQEITEALLWKLPRKKSLMFGSFKIGGKEISPPELRGKLNHVQEDGPIEVYLDITKENDRNGGIWLTDATTGFRILKCSTLGLKHLPAPFWDHKLSGDIIVPGLLSNQDTSRSGLKADFLASKEWREFCLYLQLNIKKDAEALLGEQIGFGNDDLSRTIDGIIKMFSDSYGDANPTDLSPDNSIWDENDDGTKPTAGTKPTGDRPTVTRPTVKVTVENEKRERKQRRRLTSDKYIRIGENTYALARQQLDAHILAQVDTSGTAIFINHEHVYLGMPKRKEARDEHIINQLIEAVATNEFEYQTHKMRVRVGELRAILFKRR